MCRYGCVCVGMYVLVWMCMCRYVCTSMDVDV